MKICFFSDAKSIHTRRWVQYFSEKGHEVHLLSFTKGSVNGAVMHYIGPEPPLDRRILFSFGAQHLKKVLQIKKILRKIKPDIVHGHYIVNHAFYAALSSFHPLVVSAWGSDILVSAKKVFLSKLIVKYTLKKADIITASSRYLSEETSRYAKNKRINILPFGVDTEMFSPKQRNQKKNMVVGVVKYLKPIYGIDVFISALPIIVKFYPDLRVIISGDGPQKPYLKKIVNMNNLSGIVEFVGEVPHDKVPEYIGKMDIFVMPSLSESFGVSALEAESMEIPVVATNVGGIPEVVVNEVTGLLVKPNNHWALANAIIKLLSNNDLRTKMGKNGRKLVIEKYNWQENMEKIEKIYKSLI